MEIKKYTYLYLRMDETLFKNVIENTSKAKFSIKGNLNLTFNLFCRSEDRLIAHPRSPGHAHIIDQSGKRSDVLLELALRKSMCTTATSVFIENYWILALITSPQIMRMNIKIYST